MDGSRSMTQERPRSYREPASASEDAPAKLRTQICRRCTGQTARLSGRLTRPTTAAFRRQHANDYGVHDRRHNARSQHIATICGYSPCVYVCVCGVLAVPFPTLATPAAAMSQPRSSKVDNDAFPIAQSSAHTRQLREKRHGSEKAMTRPRHNFS